MIHPCFWQRHLTNQNTTRLPHIIFHECIGAAIQSNPIQFTALFAKGGTAMTGPVQVHALKHMMRKALVRESAFLARQTFLSR